MTITCSGPFYSYVLCVEWSFCAFSSTFISNWMHYQSPNCSFFDWQRAIKLILHLACLVNINCSSLQLIKKGPTVYHMCPTLITFTNHTTPPPPNPIVTLRTCVWGLAISTYLTHTTTYYALAPNRMIFFSCFSIKTTLTLIHIVFLVFLLLFTASCG